ncbi:DUF3604 domain-containing protein [Halieaceae bacterium IMCC14734]|uniref:DUF3604 domain-containing protein n=1 Tax=Candidatus Litorirhabdus singularis TaxID=2518993 RepID=A0ABT3TKT8_9GAMM|nr:DUF3604 domain-containing protein [Candidatus Litorirhabdus singularis]MCX2982929.1 DUF3604 domain-containing protein [Candidatus Litorirhabdus singularis]
MLRKLSLAAVIVAAMIVAAPLAASADESAGTIYTAVDYPTQVLWGDTHLHTTNSLDARILGVTLNVADSYEFARGDEVVTSSGHKARLSRPLDFLVVSDHSDAMGVVDRLISGSPKLMASPELQEMRSDLISGGAGTLRAIGAITAVLIDENYSGPLLNQEVMRSVWDDYLETADRYNEPGRFTAMIGYEWTPTQSGDKLHRNVLYRGDAESASQMMPFTANKSINPQDLWKWMQRYEDKTGDKVLALAHNGNLSNGKMFPVETNPNTGFAIDAEYVRARARWEPLFEVTQIKGDSESHPALSPEDEFADFETWDRGNASLAIRKTPEMLPYEYAREALKNGLKLERQLGENPYQFGMVGSTDSHTGLSTADENYFFGKFTHEEPVADRMNEPMVDNGMPDGWKTWEMSSSGYAGVWAKENTRAAIWDAMQRREVYATTGPRMTVRFFGGWEFSEDDASFQKLASSGYARGVPMGGTLQASQDMGAPKFLVGAMKDPLSGHLDRIQIVKGWLDAEGVTHEKIFNVAWSDPDQRKMLQDGRLPPVGNTVNVADATWLNTIGDAELVGYWQDPEFDASQPGVYYLRVLEIPTPRWTAYDAKQFGDTPAAGTEMTLQERAYTSPIWYSPDAK